MIDAAQLFPNVWPAASDAQRARLEAAVASCRLRPSALADIASRAELYAVRDAPVDEYDGAVDWEYAVAYAEDAIRAACARRTALFVSGGIGGGIAAIAGLYYLTK